MAKPKIEIIVTADTQDAASALDRIADGAGKVDSAGRQAMIGLRAVGEAGQLVGAGDSFQRMATSAAMAADVVGDLSGAFLRLNPAVLAITALAAGSVFLASKLTETTPEVNALNQELSGLAKKQDAVRGLMELSGAAEQQAQAALIAARANQAYANELDELVKKTQKDIPYALKETGGAYVALAAMVGEYIATLGNQNAALEAGRSMFKTVVPEAWALVEAEDALNKKVAEADAINERIRLTDVYKRSIVQAAAEQERFHESIAKLDAGLIQSLSKMETQWAEAVRSAGLKRVQIEQDTTDQIIRINSQLAQRIIGIQNNLVQQVADIEYQATQRQSDAHQNYVKSMRELNRSIALEENERARRRVQMETDAAESIARINADLANTLNGISRDSANREATAKTWAEVQRIRKDTKARQDEAEKKAQLARDEVATKLRKAQEEFERRVRLQDAEFDHRRNLLNEEYRNSSAIRDRETRDAIARAQRIANEQIEQARLAAEEQRRQVAQTKQKQLDAISTQLAEQRRAINNQRDEQVAATQAAKDAETRAYERRMKELQDTRNENQRLKDAMVALAGPAWEPWLARAREYIDVVRSAPTPSLGTPPSFQHGYRPAGWYASGLDTIVNKPTLIGVGERGAERVTVTPLSEAGKHDKSGARTIQFYNCNFRNVDDVYAALDRWDRGLR